MTSKDQIVENGEAIVGSSLSSELEYRNGLLQSYSNFPNPFTITGLDVTGQDLGGGNWTFTVNPGSAFIQGKIYKITQAVVKASTPAEDVVIAVFYNASADIAPDYDCFSIQLVNSSTWEFPAHSPSGDAYCPLAIFDFSEDNIVNEIRSRVPHYYITQDSGFIGYDENSDKNGVFDIINESPILAGLVNYALRVKMVNTNGYAIISDGRTRLKDDVVIDNNSSLLDNLGNNLFTFVDGKIGIDKTPVKMLDINGDFACTDISASSMTVSGNIDIGGTLSIATLTVSSTITLNGYVDSNFHVVGRVTATDGYTNDSGTNYLTNGTVDFDGSSLYMNGVTITTPGGSLTMNGSISIRTTGDGYRLEGDTSHLYMLGNNSRIYGTGTDNNIYLIGVNSYVRLTGASAYIEAPKFKQPSYRKVITVSPADFFGGRLHDTINWTWDNMLYVGTFGATIPLVKTNSGTYISGDTLYFPIGELIHGAEFKEAHIDVACSSGTTQSITVTVALVRGTSTVLATSGAQAITPGSSYTFNLTGLSSTIDKSETNHYEYQIRVLVTPGATDTDETGAFAYINNGWVVIETDHPWLSSA